MVERQRVKDTRAECWGVGLGAAPKMRATRETAAVSVEFGGEKVARRVEWKPPIAKDPELGL